MCKICRLIILFVSRLIESTLVTRSMVGLAKSVLEPSSTSVFSQLSHTLNPVLAIIQCVHMHKHPPMYTPQAGLRAGLYPAHNPLRNKHHCFSPTYSFLFRTVFERTS